MILTANPATAVQKAPEIHVNSTANRMSAATFSTDRPLASRMLSMRPVAKVVSASVKPKNSTRLTNAWQRCAALGV
jgi:hypothetical protein